MIVADVIPLRDREGDEGVRDRNSVKTEIEETEKRRKQKRRRRRRFNGINKLKSQEEDQWGGRESGKDGSRSANQKRGKCITSEDDKKGSRRVGNYIYSGTAAGKGTRVHRDSGRISIDPSSLGDRQGECET